MDSDRYSVFMIAQSASPEHRQYTQSTLRRLFFVVLTFDISADLHISAKFNILTSYIRGIILSQ